MKVKCWQITSEFRGISPFRYIVELEEYMWWCRETIEDGNIGNVSRFLAEEIDKTDWVLMLGNGKGEVDNPTDAKENPEQLTYYQNRQWLKEDQWEEVSLEHIVTQRECNNVTQLLEELP